MKRSSRTRLYRMYPCLIYPCRIYPCHHEAGWVVQGALSLVLIIVVAASFLLFTFGKVVNPGWLGVRQISFGPGQGFHEQALSSGYHWSIPGYSSIHLVPRTVQVVSLHREGAGALEIQTADRATVDVDISVLVHYFVGSGTENGRPHGGPAELLQRIGLGQETWENHIRRTAEDRLKRTLGKLSAPEFYNPFKRQEQIDAALIGMNDILAGDGIKVEAVLLRRYTYRDERIDNAIFQKNLQDQEERLNATSGTLAAAQAQLEQVAAEWDAKIETLKVEGEKQSQILRSEGDLVEAERRAAGDLGLAKARAEVDRLRADALAKSAGARVQVARQLAPLLGSLRGGVVQDVDPYDLNAWMKKLGVADK